MCLQVLDFAIPLGPELVEVVPQASFGLTEFLSPLLKLTPLNLDLLLGDGLGLGELAVFLVQSPVFAREFTLQALVRLKHFFDLVLVLIFDDFHHRVLIILKLILR